MLLWPKEGRGPRGAGEAQCHPMTRLLVNPRLEGGKMHRAENHVVLGKAGYWQAARCRPSQCLAMVQHPYDAHRTLCAPIQVQDDYAPRDDACRVYTRTTLDGVNEIGGAKAVGDLLDLSLAKTMAARVPPTTWDGMGKNGVWWDTGRAADTALDGYCICQGCCILEGNGPPRSKRSAIPAGRVEITAETSCGKVPSIARKKWEGCVARPRGKQATA